MKKRLLLCVLLACTMLCALVPVTASAADAVSMQPCYSLPFAPEGTTYGQVTFSVPADVQGLTKDAWDNGLDHNTDLILLSFVKDGVAYENMTVREIKDMLGDLPLKRTCYTYENGPDGTIYLNLRFHMDDHSKLKPSDFTAVTVKAGFVWCAGSPSGIDKELSALTLEHDVYFPVNQKAGITAVQVGAMPGGDGALRVRFERKDRESLKAISAVDLCPSAIPGNINPVVPASLMDENTKILVNPTGRFVVGGPMGDSGLTGRKIIVDTYGGYSRHGGGAFSGKDPTKVDRSASYAARYIAKNVVAAGLANKCEVQIAYAIGVAKPVSVMIDTFGTAKVDEEKISAAVSELVDLRPAAIIKRLDLRRPIYRETAAYGHMGREDLEVLWEKTDIADKLRQMLL